MNPIESARLIEQLSWRYAVKKFDPSRKISAPTWDTIERAAVLAPSSYGLQPWRMYVIDDPSVRTKLRAASWNQPQITDASHLVVFARRVEITTAYVEDYIARTAKTRGVTVESLKGFRDMMVGQVNAPASLPGGSMDVYCARQTYIALGFFLYTAAALGIDACPMEGFEPAKYDEILGLRAQGYTATVLGAAGYRAGDDWLASQAKVRLPHHEAVVHV
ncbi:MAG: NAD(P)H-dependent oxidoreductase [Phycisphaeraceae bacterium]|nr:MAG: NAD(P)H-dependent oxidoreductase [Phycisphaeraceae bacterium]